MGSPTSSPPPPVDEMSALPASRPVEYAVPVRSHAAAAPLLLAAPQIRLLFSVGDPEGGGGGGSGK